MRAEKIRVNIGRGYDVTIGAGVLSHCGEELAAVLTPGRIAVVTDSKVERMYLAETVKSLESAGFEVCAMSFPEGEASKSMETLAAILDFLAESGLTRASCVAALGGGVVGDITGLAAGLYMRGVDYVQLPTTLLAAVDSSVGGKTAVNLAAGKNLAGLFIQPAAVICDTDCLRTLGEAEFSDGAAEAIKTGILGDSALFEIFERGGASGSEAEIISRCVKFKAAVTQADERERGARKLLNLGHTAGHAIEKCSGYKINHGHAVSMGLAIISRAAQALGYCSGECARRIIRTLEGSGLPTRTDFSASELAAAALSDKKRSGEEITLVFPCEIGECVLEDVPISRLSEIFSAGMGAEK